jgi:5-amino-6-(5-phosphoribosylamino)uracil reductase/diaminohydroxyphosphoribosylaminopyrimidine deaminase/5-amino-6-(5-phosphoribosylamino)uracil reductase
LGGLLTGLAGRGIRSVLIEGGSGIITAAFRGRLADRLVLCIAPRLVGSGLSAVGDLQIRQMDQALRFTHSSFRMVGSDLVFEGEL